MTLPYTFSILCWLTSALSGVFGIVIAVNRWKAPRSSPVTLWALFCLAVSAWSLGLGMMTRASSQAEADFWIKFHYLGAIFIPIFFLHFSLSFLQESARHRVLLGIAYTLTTLFHVLNFLGRLAIAVPKRPFSFYTAPGAFYNLYSLFFFCCVVFAQYRLIIASRRAHGFQKNQIYYLFLGTAIGFGGGSTAFFPVYDIPIFPFGVPLAAVYVFIVGYAILIYKLMDFSLIMRWGVVFGASLGTVIAVFCASVFLFEKVLSAQLHFSSGIPTILAASFSVLLFDPVRNAITKLADRIIFRSPDLKLKLEGIYHAVETSLSLNELVINLTALIKQIWQLDHAGFCIWHSESSSFSASPAEQFSGTPIFGDRFSIGLSDFLIRTMATERRLFKYGIVTDDEVTTLGNRSMPGERTTYWKIRRTMRWVGASVTAPLMMNDQIVGFIVVGRKPEGNLFNEEDRKLLAHIADLIAIRVSNYLTLGPGYTPGNFTTQQAAS